MTEHVVTSYTEMMAAIQAQVGALELKLTDFDDLAGFAAGLSGKVFGPSQAKRLGPEKLFDALRAAGLRIRIEVDPDQEAKMRARISENFNPRQANQARPNNHASPVGTALASRVFRHFAKQGGKASMSAKSKVEMRQHQRHAANSRWCAYRKQKALKERLRLKRARLANESAKSASRTESI